MLIDAGSTLTAEDLNTIIALQEAAVPVQVLISKADLLSDPDSVRLTEYVSTQIESRCGELYPVWPVSVQPSHRHLLDQWYGDQILPLSEESKALKDASVQRKIGLLRESVISVLQSRIGPVIPLTPERKNHLREVDGLLRQGNARIEKTRQETLRMSEQMFSNLTPLWNSLTPALVDRISSTNGHENTPDDLIKQTIMHYVQERVSPVHDQIQSLATRLKSLIRDCTSLLALDEQPDEDHYLSLIRDMPIFDPGEMVVTFSLPVYSSVLGRSYLEKTVNDQLIRQLKAPLTFSLKTYEKQFIRWNEQIIRLLY